MHIGEGLLSLGDWDTALGKCYQDDCSCPSKTACGTVVVACLPSTPTSDNQSEEWYQKCGFAAIRCVVLRRELRGRPEWRTVMFSSAGGKQ